MDIALLAKIIFDFDGVMIDLADLYFTEIEAVAKAFGVKQPAMEEIARHWGKGLSEFLKNIISEVTMEEFLQKSAELGFQRSRGAASTRRALVPASPGIPGARSTVR